jgi:hypothetical protein
VEGDGASHGIRTPGLRGRTCVRGDIFFSGEIMAGALIASIPVAIAYNSFLDRFIEGITGGAVK